MGRGFYLLSLAVNTRGFEQCRWLLLAQSSQATEGTDSCIVIDFHEYN